MSPLDAAAYASTDLLSLLLANTRLTEKFVTCGNEGDDGGGGGGGQGGAAPADYDFRPMNILLQGGLMDLAAIEDGAWYVVCVLDLVFL